MRHPFLAVASLALAFTVPNPALAQTPAAALTGVVSSAGEVVMEGVLVSAALTGSTLPGTVGSGADGRFSFPADRLAAGQYNLSVRAVGYDLDPPAAVQVADQKTAVQDLK